MGTTETMAVINPGSWICKVCKEVFDDTEPRPQETSMGWHFCSDDCLGVHLQEGGTLDQQETQDNGRIKGKDA